MNVLPEANPDRRPTLDYSLTYQEAPWDIRWLQRWRPRICPWEPVLTHIPQGSSVMDYGCGAGGLLLELAWQNRIRRGLGLDISARHLTAAQRAWERLSLRRSDVQIEFRLLNDALPSQQRAWDIVTMVDVLHHVPVPLQRHAFAQAARCVRPGGLFIWKDMAPRPRWRAWMNRLHDLVVARQWIHYVPLQSAAAWSQEWGGKMLECQRYSHLWYAHQLAAFRLPSPAML